MNYPVFKQLDFKRVDQPCNISRTTSFYLKKSAYIVRIFQIKVRTCAYALFTTDCKTEV